MLLARLSDLNWRRGLAEVALIFIGITLALLFDNWNEARKDRLLEEQLFAALRADLLETRADLVTDIDITSRRVANTVQLIDAIAADNPPSEAGGTLPWGEIGTSRLYQKNFAYRALVSQDLGSISNRALLQAATDLYELQFSRVASAENGAFAMEDRVMERLSPYLAVPRASVQTLRAGQGTAAFLRTAPLEVIDWAGLQADREILLWLMELLERSQAALAFYERALEHLDAVLAMIDRDIGAQDEAG